MHSWKARMAVDWQSVGDLCVFLLSFHCAWVVSSPFFFLPFLCLLIVGIFYRLRIRYKTD